MRPVNYLAKADHFAELAARAAYRAALCRADGFGPEADEWESRAAEYDSRAASYRVAARKAA